MHAQPVVQQRRHALGSPKSLPMGLVPDLDLYFSPSGPFVPPKVLMQHLETDTCSFYPYQSEKEQTEFAPIARMTGTASAQNLGIHASLGSSTSYVQANGNT